MITLGSLVLNNQKGGIIKNCYGYGLNHQDGVNYGGALCRNNFGEIDSCYTAILRYDTYWSGGSSAIGSAIAGRNSGTIRNCYYLNQSSASVRGINGTDVTGQAESKSESELKELAGILGSAFKKDYDEPINDGYPILSWQ